MKCPNCGTECDRDEVDVGVGVIHGPWSCFQCGWSEETGYDSSRGPSPAQVENPEHHLDPCGGLTPGKRNNDPIKEQSWQRDRTQMQNLIDPDVEELIKAAWEVGYSSGSLDTIAKLTGEVRDV